MSTRQRVGLAALIGVTLISLFVLQGRALTGTVYPDGDVTRGWTVTPTGCTTTTHYACIDEATHSTTDYVNTGTGLTAPNTEEYTMTSVASSNVSITNIAVLINANSVACNGNTPNCDTLSVNIRIGGVLQTAQLYTPTATNSQTTLNFTTGTPWTSDSDLQVVVTRNTVGGGNASNADDDMRLTGLKAVVTYTNNAFYSMSGYRVFNNDNNAAASDTFTKLADPATLPVGSAYSPAFSPDGTYMSVSHTTTPFITIYKRSGDTFTKLADPATLPTGIAYSTAFSPDGTYMSVSHATSPFVTIYKRSGDTFTKLADPATLPPDVGRGVTFSPDGTHMSVAHSTTPFITIYKRSGDTFTKLADPAALPPSTGFEPAFSPDGTYMSVGHGGSPYITIYKRSGDTFTKLADPAALPTGSGNGVAFSPDGTYMSVAHVTSPYITIYKRSGDTFTKLADPATVPTGIAYSTAFSPDGNHMSLTHIGSPYVTIYKRSGDTFTKIADPSTLPTGTGNGVTFSTDGTYMSVASNTSPYITIYKRSLDANVGTPIAATNTATSIGGTGVPFRLRLNLHVSNGQADAGKSFRLQVATRSGTCDTAHSGEIFDNVTTTTNLRYYDNSNLADAYGVTVAAGGADPTHGADSVVRQSYEESNDFSIAAPIAAGSDGMWDFSLVFGSSAPFGSYCLRVIDSSGNPIATPTAVPEVTLVAPTFGQANYRWFANVDASAPGGVLAAQDTSASIASSTPFRLRQRIAVDAANHPASGEFFKLQYAEKSGVCDPGFSGETYGDVNASGTQFVSTYNLTDSATVHGDNLKSTWVNRNFALTDTDDAGTTDTSLFNVDGSSETLRVTGDPPSIPSNATITGIRVALQGWYYGDLSLEGQLVINGAPKGNRVALNNTTLQGSTVYTGGNSDLWGASWTAAELNTTTNLGVDLTAVAYDLITSPSQSVDHVYVQVYYSLPSAMGYHNNATPANGATISSSGNDPINGARPTVYQTYNETDPFAASVAGISAGSDGLWDFAMTTQPSAAGKSYCFRVVKSSGSLLDSYTYIPEISITSGAGPSATLEQKLRGGQSVINGVKSPFDL